MKRRLWGGWAVRALGCLTLLVASCGQRESADRVTLRFLDAPDVNGVWGGLIERFEKENPEIDVVLVEGPSATDARGNMYATSFLAGENTYDLVYMDVVWLPPLAAQGWLLPLDDFFPPSIRDAFLPGDLNGSVYHDRFYRVPIQTDAGVLYYRKDILESHGLQPPRTFNDFVTLARKFHNPPRLYGYVFQGKQYEGLTCNFLEVLWGHGGELWNPAQGVVLNSPEGLAALHWMVEAVRDHPMTPPGILTYQEEEARHLFQEGRALFMRNWPYAFALLQRPDSPVQGKVGMIPMVHAEGQESASTLGGWGFGVSRFSPHPEAAWKFIEFAADAQSQKDRFTTAGYLPTRKSLYRDPELLKHSPQLSEIYPILLSARPRPRHSQYPRISDILQQHISAALSGVEFPEEAIAAATQEITLVVQ